MSKSKKVKVVDIKIDKPLVNLNLSGKYELLTHWEFGDSAGKETISIIFDDTKDKINGIKHPNFFKYLTILKNFHLYDDSEDANIDISKIYADDESELRVPYNEYMGYGKLDEFELYYYDKVGIKHNVCIITK